LGRYGEAIKSFEKAIELNPEDPDDVAGKDHAQAKKYLCFSDGHFFHF
jgi:hypothetical protein